MPEETSETCSKCGGSGFRSVSVDGIDGVVKCECTNQNLSERLLRAAEIPRRYMDCQLDNYVTRPEQPHLSMALIKATGYVEDYLIQPKAKGLLFQGAPGLGKTHLAVGIIRRLIETKSVSCCFCDFAGELQKIRDSLGSDQSLNLPRLVYDAAVLVLDDFGAQRWSGWVQDQMSNVISYRYNHGRATIITTNLSDKPSSERNAIRVAALKKLGVMDHEGRIDTFQKTRLEQCGIRFTSVRDEPETLEDQIGDRLRSRLYEMCEIVPMYGLDYRRWQAERTQDIRR